MMPTAPQATFTKLDIDGQIVVLSTPKTKAMLRMDSIVHVTMNSTTNSISMIITDTARGDGMISYSDQAVADADWTKLAALLNSSQGGDDNELQAQVDQNSADIDANQQSIVNLNNDLGAMFNRLNALEAQVQTNVQNLDNLGQRVTALENA